MTIKGLTDRGMAFPEIGQIRKGAAKTENRPGKDLTYFRVTFDEREAKAQEAFLSVYGAEPTAIKIILPFNEISRMWDAWLEGYTAGRMIARSDGEFIHYQVDGRTGKQIVLNGIDVATNQPKPHPQDNVAGVDYQGKPVYFKPSGRLKIIVPDLARAAYLTVLTTSKHDIANISDQLRAFSELNRGQIAGIPFILRRRPKKISVPGKDGQRTRMTKWMLSIEADPDWVKAKLLEVKRLALPGNGLALLTPGENEPEPDELEGEYSEVGDEDDGDWPEAEDEPPIPQAMSLELAMSETGSSGEKYGDLDSQELSNRSIGIGKALAKNNISPEKREELLRKQAAIGVILAHRNLDATQ